MERQYAATFKSVICIPGFPTLQCGSDIAPWQHASGRGRWLSGGGTVASLPFLRGWVALGWQFHHDPKPLGKGRKNSEAARAGMG